MKLLGYGLRKLALGGVVNCTEISSRFVIDIYVKGENKLICIEIFFSKKKKSGRKNRIKKLLELPICIERSYYLSFFLTKEPGNART